MALEQHPGYARSAAEDDKRGVTLGELSKFVAAAYATGGTDDTQIWARVGLRDQIKQIWTGRRFW